MLLASLGATDPASIAVRTCTVPARRQDAFGRTDRLFAAAFRGGSYAQVWVWAARNINNAPCEICHQAARSAGVVSWGLNMHRLRVVQSPAAV